MRNRYTFQINLDQVLINLFYCYAFSISFELVFEILFGMDTIFKPFRIFSLFIIGVFGIKFFFSGLHLDTRDKIDWFLYGVFVYGIIISCWRIITGVFDMGLFFNDIFQVSLHVATFFIFKLISITRKQAIKIFYCFLLGTSVNAFYVVYKYVGNMSWGRQAGFMDNPNYAAFGLVAAIIFLALRIDFFKKASTQFWSIKLLLFFLFVFSIQGSRTGLIMFGVAYLLVLFFSKSQRKLIIVAGIAGFFILLPKQIDFTRYSVLIRRLDKKMNTDESDVRFEVWKGVFRVLEDEGYFGMGIGQFKANFSKYFSLESNNLIVEMVDYGYFLSTHNDYLAILTDYGLPSLICYLFFLGFTFLKLFQKLKFKKEDKDEEFLIQFCFTFFVCIAIFGMAAENFHHQLYWFLLMFTTKKYTFSNE